jgi:hypothetical protein
MEKEMNGEEETETPGFDNLPKSYEVHMHNIRIFKYLVNFRDHYITSDIPMSHQNLTGLVLNHRYQREPRINVWQRCLGLAYRTITLVA